MTGTIVLLCDSRRGVSMHVPSMDVECGRGKVVTAG
jgi:hypothetical protein